MDNQIKMRISLKQNKINIGSPSVVVNTGGGGVEPTGVIDITENGEYNVKYYAGANVNVPIPEGYIVPEGTFSAAKVGTYDVTEYAEAEFSVETETKEFTPTEEEQVYQPDEDIYITSVKVNPIPEQYIVPSGNIDIVDTNSIDVTSYASAQIKDENLKAENIAENVKVLGITGTFRGGIDTSDGTATSDDLLAGKIAYSNEQRLVGTIETYDGSFIVASTEVLPDEYTQLMYIEGTGEQYIDTEFNMVTTCELDIQMEIMEYNTQNKMGFFGSYEAGSVIYQLYASGVGNQYFCVSFGGKNYQTLNKFALNTIYDITVKANTVIINSVPHNFTSDGVSDATQPLYLFWRNATGDKAKMRLYSCNIYNNGFAIRRFVPCARNTDGAIGLYDFITEKFYENKGTGTFIGG